MATFKQYLQNRWYRWMSHDRTVAYPYQFQFWCNVNVRNEKWAVMLASWHTENDITTGTFQNLIQVAPGKTDVTFTLTYNSIDNISTLWITDNLLWESLPASLWYKQAYFKSWKQTLSNETPFWPRIKPFRDWVFVVNWQSERIYFTPWVDWVVEPWETVASYDWVKAMDIVHNVWDPNVTYESDDHIHCVYNFADTFFLVATWGILLRYQPLTNDVTNMANWKVIRYFWRNRTIVWLSQSWNYLKIYVTDWIKTECHYAQWTFDLEESWIVQTIKYEWILLEDCLATDWVKDYGLFRTNIWIQLLEMDWYDYNIIRKTERRTVMTQEPWPWVEPTTEMIFYDPRKKAGMWWTMAKVLRYDNTLYCSIPDEWIWTFTKESVWSHWWVWWWVVEWYKWWSTIQQMMIHNWIMLTLHTTWTIGSQSYSALCRTEINNYPNFYVEEWYIIGNIYDWWCGSLFKKNVSTTMVCGNSIPWQPYNWIIMLWYRYDRKNNTVWNPFAYWLDMVKAIETKDIYDSVFITSVQQDLWDISGEDIPTSPRMFNAPRNTIEYFIMLSVPVTVYQDEEYYHTEISPILYEHNLIYEDSMRKYR